MLCGHCVRRTVPGPVHVRLLVAVVNRVPHVRESDEAPTIAPTTSWGPSRPPADVPEDTIMSRGSYCGTGHDDALVICSPSTNCVSDDDCNGFGAVDRWGSKACHLDISCTIDVRYADEMAWARRRRTITSTGRPTSAALVGIRGIRAAAGSSCPAGWRPPRCCSACF